MGNTLNKDKQIEEMQEMASILTEASHLACEDIPLLPTDMTICYKIPCHRCKETRLLSYKGYAKASEVAVEVINRLSSRVQIMMSALNCEIAEKPVPVSEFNKGAKATLEMVFKDLTELKKKYTEEE